MAHVAGLGVWIVPSSPACGARAAMARRRGLYRPPARVSARRLAAGETAGTLVEYSWLPASPKATSSPAAFSGVAGVRPTLRGPLRHGFYKG